MKISNHYSHYCHIQELNRGKVKESTAALDKKLLLRKKKIPKWNCKYESWKKRKISKCKYN